MDYVRRKLEVFFGGKLGQTVATQSNCWPLLGVANKYARQAIVVGKKKQIGESGSIKQPMLKEPSDPLRAKLNNNEQS
jgi:hypothetical protein